jgi:hypothetical protein
VDGTIGCTVVINDSRPIRQVMTLELLRLSLVDAAAVSFHCFSF